MEHVHESPPVMTMPLVLLAIGAMVAGFSFHEQLSGADWMRFWGQLDPQRARTTMCSSAHAAYAGLGRTGAERGRARRHRAGLRDLHVRARRCPTRLASAVRGRSTGSCSTSGISTSCTTSCSCGRPWRWRASLWQVGDVAIIDGVPNGLATLTADSSGQVMKLQTGSIAVYAFAMLIGLVVLSLLVLLLIVVAR